jgi:hypothetical protein
MKEF